MMSDDSCQGDKTWHHLSVSVNANFLFLCRYWWRQTTLAFACMTSEICLCLWSTKAAWTVAVRSKPASGEKSKPERHTAQICPSPILHFYWKLENMSESQGSRLVLVVMTTLSLWAAQRTSMCTSGAHTTTWANSPLYGETAMTSGKGSKVMME